MLRSSSRMYFYDKARNSFMTFRAGLKVNLRQYIKSDFDLFWGPDVLWRSDFDVINRSSNFIRLLLNSPLESHWIRGLKLTSKLRAVQFWVNWKKWQQNQNVVRQFQAVQCEWIFPTTDFKPIGQYCWTPVFPVNIEATSKPQGKSNGQG